MAELWVGSGGGVLLEPPESRSCRKHHLLGETEDNRGEEGREDEREEEVGLVKGSQHIFICACRHNSTSAT